jgi:NAD(P)H dehydrogenase (quinone)
MKYVISGASSVVGQLTAERLLKQCDPEELTLISRSPTSLQSWADKGVNVLAGHHGDAESLREGYKHADCVFMISSLSVGERIAHHRDSIKVAKEEGVKHIVYTSVGGIHPKNPTPSAIEHSETEKMLWDSGIGFTALRNQMYSEMVYMQVCDQALPTGKWMHNSLKGGFAPVSRVDIAKCAAAIMQSPSEHSRVCYDITGPERMTYEKVAALASKVFERDIEYTQASNEQMREIYASMGAKPEPDSSSTFPPVLFGSDELVNQFVAYEMGVCDIQTKHVELITGEAPISLEELFRQLKAAQE